MGTVGVFIDVFGDCLFGVFVDVFSDYLFGVR